MRDDYTHDTPGTVTAAVACGVAPVPLLAVYSVIFMIHGSIRPVHPPDVTGTQRGEFIAGCVSFVLLVLVLIALLWFLNGKRRWPLAILELAGAAAFTYIVVEPTLGGRLIAALLALTSLASFVLLFAPRSWWWVDRRAPRWLRAPVRAEENATAV